MSRRKRKKMVSDVLSFSTTGIAAGVGAYAIGAADVSGSVPHAKTAMGSLTTMMPVTGTIMGASWAMDALGGLKPKKRKRRQ